MLCCATVGNGRVGVEINIAHNREELFIGGGTGETVSREDGTLLMH